MDSNHTSFVRTITAAGVLGSVFVSICVGVLIIGGVFRVPMWVGVVLVIAPMALIVLPLLFFSMFRPVRNSRMTLGDMVFEFFENFIPPWP